MRTLQRLLIANRGEIACRIMRTAKAMGIETVAIHSLADAQAMHVCLADYAINLGGNTPEESYLQIERIIAAAQSTGADAIHPGYGFLAENADFARAVDAAGLVFIGPPASAIEAMGSKSAAKSLMEQAGVPLVPGYHGEEQSLERFQQAAQEIGYPVLLKASAGGGGRGMQVVETPTELAEAFDSAKREASAAFGDERMLIEKYVLKPRHVEVQVFADTQGNCIYLAERDCSIQRRHQKVVEEAPAPGISAKLRQAMGEAAVRAAQAVGYVNAGTVEFLLDSRGEFYFMEMNTRLQVEHPITELITHTDLVAWQIKVAQGQQLPLTQADVAVHGHAMEVRLYAEDPAKEFLPAAGTLTLYREPQLTQGQRIDSGVRQGDDISPFYDPMIAKLIAWGETREEARLRLLNMLKQTYISGVKTNISFLQRIVAEPAFAQGQVHTGFIEDHKTTLFASAAPLSALFWQLAGAAWIHSSTPQAPPEDPHTPWATLKGWQNSSPPSAKLRFSHQGDTHCVEINASTLASTHWQDDTLTYHDEQQRYRLKAIRTAQALHLQWGETLYTLTLADSMSQAQAQQTAGGLVAPMHGSIVKVAVTTGQAVAAGDLLVVVEAMKMEHSIRAVEAGVITALFCAQGDSVSEGTTLVEMETNS